MRGAELDAWLSALARVALGSAAQHRTGQSSTAGATDRHFVVLSPGGLVAHLSVAWFGSESEDLYGEAERMDAELGRLCERPIRIRHVARGSAGSGMTVRCEAGTVRLAAAPEWLADAGPAPLTPGTALELFVRLPLSAPGDGLLVTDGPVCVDVGWGGGRFEAVLEPTPNSVVLRSCATASTGSGAAAIEGPSLRFDAEVVEATTGSWRVRVANRSHRGQLEGEWVSDGRRVGLRVREAVPVSEPSTGTYEVSMSDVLDDDATVALVRPPSRPSSSEEA